MKEMYNKISRLCTSIRFFLSKHVDQQKLIISQGTSQTWIKDPVWIPGRKQFEPALLFQFFN